MATAKRKSAAKKTTSKKVVTPTVSESHMHTTCEDCKIQLIVKVEDSDKCYICKSPNVIKRDWRSYGKEKEAEKAKKTNTNTPTEQTA